jgi:hypothetical protein
MDHDSRVTIEYLRSLPRDAVVRWASDHLTAERPWATGWIDIRIADGGPPGMGWVWTIVRGDDPDDPKPGELWCFVWPHDLDVHGVQAWSERTVCEALSTWAGRHAGRADLRFEWDRETGPSAALAEAMARAAASDPVWDLGDGLQVVDGLMDELLALHPDEAAELTHVLREAGSLLADSSMPPDAPSA